MSFVKLNPIIRTGVWKTIGLSVTYCGTNLKLRILFCTDIMKAIGAGVGGGKVDCLQGEGDDAGTLLIRKGLDFAIARHSKDVGRVDVPLPDGVPRNICNVMDAEYKKTKDGLVITIPKLVPKKKGLTAGRKKVAPHKHVEPETPIEAVPVKIDTPEVLKSKGISEDGVKYLMNNQEETHPKADRD
ncbi:MAG: hypothetical protein JKY45_03225 [Emcibacter sp.]|nr:hypothetical protein [Emcibacter sp.]